MMLSQRALRLALTFMLLFGVAGAATACPMCAEALTNGEGQVGTGLASGFYYSILFMLSFPFSIIAFFGFMFYRLHRKSMLDAGEPAPDVIVDPGPASS